MSLQEFLDIQSNRKYPIRIKQKLSNKSNIDKIIIKASRTHKVKHRQIYKYHVRFKDLDTQFSKDKIRHYFNKVRHNILFNIIQDEFGYKEIQILPYQTIKLTNKELKRFNHIVSMFRIQGVRINYKNNTIWDSYYEI